jgi:phospholipase C
MVGSLYRRKPGSLPHPSLPPGTPDTTLPFEHIIVVMQENHSFDNYFGMLPVRGQPKADGFRFDSRGRPLNDNPLNEGRQRVFHLQGRCQPNGVTQTWDATHAQIDNGKMDGFAKTDSEAMGYWDESDIPFYYSLANTFCLGNRYFASVPAQTYPNRRCLYSGTPEGTISSSLSTLNLPPPPHGTLMDLLAEHGLTCKDYFTDLPVCAIIPTDVEKHPLNFAPIAEYYTDCLLGLPNVAFVDSGIGVLSALFGPGAPLAGFVGSIEGLLPAPVGQAVTNAVQLANSQGEDEENPQDIAIGEAYTARVVHAAMHSPLWPKILLIWMYDEHGGYYDHVPPPAAPIPDDIPPMLSPGDYPGTYDTYGIRVPNVVVSPYSRPHSVTNVIHDHTSVLATIEAKWNLPALTYRDANAATLVDYLDLSRPTFLDPPTLARPSLPAIIEGDCETKPPPVVIESK